MLKSFSKLSCKSESMVEANRILKFNYDPEFMVALVNVQTSLRDRNYKIKLNIGKVRDLRRFEYDDV